MAATWKRRAVWIGVPIALVAAVAFSGWYVLAEARERGRLTKAKDNVSNLVKLHMDGVAHGGRGYPPVGGKAFVLWPLVERIIDPNAPSATDSG
jgi:hypothetical protein